MNIIKNWKNSIFFSPTYHTHAINNIENDHDLNDRGI
jgi:hypothetical protein